MVIAEPSQPLRRRQYDLLEMAAGEYLGPPSAMTTIVANQRTANITAHVLQGAFASPAADESAAFLRKNDGSDGLSFDQSRQLPLNKNVFVQVFDYLRRRYHFTMYAYKVGVVALRGRMRCQARRNGSFSRRSVN